VFERLLNAIVIFGKEHKRLRTYSVIVLFIVFYGYAAISGLVDLIGKGLHTLWLFMKNFLLLPKLSFDISLNHTKSMVRVSAAALSLCLVVNLMLTSVFAEEEILDTDNKITEMECIDGICDDDLKCTDCTPDDSNQENDFDDSQTNQCLCDPVIENEGVHTNPDCPYYTEPELSDYERVVELFKNLPASIENHNSDEEIKAVLKQINEAMNALDMLSDEDYQRFTEEHNDLLAALMELNQAITNTHPFTVENSSVITTLAELQNAIDNSNGTKESPTEINIDSAGITVTNTITIDGKHVKLTGGALSRDSNFKGNMIEVINGSSLTLADITLDGKSISSSGTLVKAKGSANQITAIILQEGAVLQNNITTGAGGAVNLYAGYKSNENIEFTMNGGTIKNNTAQYGGAIADNSNSPITITINAGEITGNAANGDSSMTWGGAIYSGSTLIINGGEITNNSTTGRGGGIYKAGNGTIFNMTGGTIKENTARDLASYSSSGGNVYVASGTFTLDGKANIPNGLALTIKNNDPTFYIASALENAIEIEGIYDNPGVGTLVAAGANDYEITADDIAKLSYRNKAFSFELDDVNNQIKLRNMGYTVNYYLVGVKGDATLPTFLEKGKDLSIKLVPTDGYKVGVDEVKMEVKVNNTVIQPFQLWNYEDGCVISIKSSAIKGDIDITVEAVEKSSNAQLSELTYWYASDPGDVLIPEFSKDAKNPVYNVMLPYSVTDTQTIYVDKKLSDKNAKFDGAAMFCLKDGKYTWQAMVTAEDGKTKNTYTINFTRMPEFLNTVYVDGENGNDTNFGDTADRAVKTFEQAKKLVANGGIIYVTGTITVADDETWSLYDKGAIIKRDSSFKTGELINVNYKGNLILNNITIDGNSVVESNKPIITVNGGKLSISNAARLRNNNNVSGYGGAVAVQNVNVTTNGIVSKHVGVVTMAGGTISNNHAKDGGAGIYVQGEFTMTGGSITSNSSAEGNGGGILISSDYSCSITGGEITGNKAAYGGGIYITTGKLTITGGKLNNNQSDKGGNGIYFMGSTNLEIGDSVKIYDNISFESSTYVTVNSKLTGGVKIPIRLSNNKNRVGKSIVKASESYNDKLDMDNFLITFDQKGYEAKLSNYGKHIDIVLSKPYLELNLDSLIKNDTVYKKESYNDSYVNFYGNDQGIAKKVYKYSITGNESEKTIIKADSDLSQFFSLTIAADETAEEIVMKVELVDHPEIFVTYTFKVSGNERYAVTVENSYAADNGADKYRQGETVTIDAGKRSGYTFDKWVSNDAELNFENDKESTTTFIMPDHAVKVTAQWISVSSGSSSSNSHTGIVERKDESYYYIKGKPADQGFVLLDEKDKLIDKLAADEFLTTPVKADDVYFVKADKTIAKYEWIILNQNGEVEKILPVGMFLKQYDSNYKVYLADSDGKLVKSWTDIEGNIYYFNNDYTAKNKYWTLYQNEWYLFDNYSLVRSQWYAASNGRWYYLDQQGRMLKNQWIDGCWINEDGIYWSPYVK